jgi:hypothetical protein
MKDNLRGRKSSRRLRCKFYEWPREGVWYGRRQIAQPTIDGAARDAYGTRNGGHAAKPGNARLRRRKHATPTSVETHTKRLVPLPNRRFINHAAVINPTSPSRNPHAKAIQLFCGIALAYDLKQIPR